MKITNSNTLPSPIAALLTALALLVVFASPGARADDSAIKSGQFSGLSGHVTTGNVGVVRTANGLVVTLADNFSLDGAPDAKVGFGRAGVYDKNSQLAPLASLTGEQSYRVPGSLNVDDYDEIYIWCEQFSVPLGVAAIR